MYILQSILANANAVWLTETLPMPMAKADKLIRVRMANATGNRRFRLIKAWLNPMSEFLLLLWSHALSSVRTKLCHERQSTRKTFSNHKNIMGNISINISPQGLGGSVSGKHRLHIKIKHNPIPLCVREKAERLAVQWNCSFAEAIHRLAFQKNTN